MCRQCTNIYIINIVLLAIYVMYCGHRFYIKGYVVGIRYRINIFVFSFCFSDNDKVLLFIIMFLFLFLLVRDQPN